MSSCLALMGCRRWLPVVCAFSLLLSMTAPARATLGEDAGSIETNRVRLQASVLVQQRTRFVMHELRLPMGSRVRQFVASSGKVFAVAWSGGWRPDLRELMGAHYERYLAAMKGKIVPRGPVKIELPGMIVIMGGHQRAFFGRIYLLEHMPSNTSLEDIH